MATYTTNYHLEKPAQSDLYNIDVFNGNADTIDTTLASKSNLSNLATVESSSTASKAYAKGDYLVYNGLLCIVTTAIASGGTITPGTNVSQTDTGTQLKSIDDELYKQWNVNFSSSGADMTAANMVSWLNANAKTAMFGNYKIVTSNNVNAGLGVAAIINGNYGALEIISYYSALHGYYRLASGTWTKS